MINATPMTTDINGEVIATLKTTHMYAITSALDALSFAPVADTGENLTARSPVALEAERLVSSQTAPCRILTAGVPNIYFSTLNKTDRSMTVPLTMSEINSLWSVTGQGAPPEVFAPGASGFTVPQNVFGEAGSLQGVWRFLGQQITVSGDVQMCADTTAPGTCESIDIALLLKPREFTRTTIMSLAKASLAAAQRGRWKPGKGGKGGFAVPFMVRGAKALAVMDRSLKIDVSQSYVCEVTPLSCQRLSMPKAKFRKAFASIFGGKPPRGLEHLYARSKRQRKKFDKVLASVPDWYVSCGK